MSKNNPHNIVVGQQLYVVYCHEDHGHYLTVHKVGNRWAVVGDSAHAHDQMKVHLVRMYIYGGDYVSPGCAYLSEQEYLDEMALKKAWSTFAQSIASSVPPYGLTLDRLAQAKSLLGLDAFDKVPD